MGILSIQSHVVYGYVGNKAATYPLQSMGHDVWPINTVQFSRHTGYKKFEGQIFTQDHISSLLKGVEDAGLVPKCKAIISGYMGTPETCSAVYDAISRFKEHNNKIIYLCDPVIGNTDYYANTKVKEFFKAKLKADIITPNHFEAEVLSDQKISTIQDLKKAAKYFHDKEVSVVIITGLSLPFIDKNKLSIFVSDRKTQNLILTEKQEKAPMSGTGDLFSSVFLGKYLRTKDALESAKQAIHLTGEAVKNSANLDELNVLSVDYKNESVFNQDVICLDDFSITNK